MRVFVQFVCMCVRAPGQAVMSPFSMLVVHAGCGLLHEQVHVCALEDCARDGSHRESILTALTQVIPSCCRMPTNAHSRNTLTHTHIRTLFVHVCCRMPPDTAGAEEKGGPSNELVVQVCAASLLVQQQQWMRATRWGLQSQG